MFLVGIIPAVLMLVGIKNAHVSPRWLVMKGKANAAAGVLRLIQPKSPQTEIDTTVAQMVEDDRAREKDVGWSHLFAPGICTSHNLT